VTMIHDLIPLHHPEFCPSLLPPIFRRWLNGAIEHSDVLMCNSRATHEDLETYCRTADLPCPPAASFRLGDDLPPESVGEQPVRPTIVRIAAEIPRRLFLCVGSIEPRKNHAVVLDAFDALWARNTCLNLLIAGRPADGADAIFERISSHPMRGKRLFYHGDCNDAELALCRFVWNARDSADRRGRAERMSREVLQA
jgi:glycosyltransferase involved in cell wall biosynthesis